MSIYELQPDQKITKTHWRLSKRRRGSCYNRSNFIRNIRSDNLTCQYFLDSKNGRSFVTSVGTVLSSNSTEYNNAGWILSSTDSYGLKTEYIYNVFGEVTQTRRQLPDNAGWIVSESVYDSQGRVVFSTDSHIENSNDPIYGTKTLYDSQGRNVGNIRYVNSEIDILADGTSTIKTVGTELYRTSTEYDSKGRTKRSTDAYGNVTTYEYDNLDRQIAVNTSSGLRSETIYNSKGQVEKTVSNIKIKTDGTYDYAESITAINTYNSLGQIIKTVTDGRIVEYEYDNLGRQIATIDHPITINGEVIRHRTETVYDELGRVSISRTNVKQLSDGTIDRSNAQELKYIYDNLGNVVKTIYADGTFITANYNDLGQKISETNQLGQTRYFEYNVKGQLIAVILPAVFDPISGKSVNPKYEYQYDEFGRQILIRDPNGHETRFEYDSFGNQISRTLPLGFGADGILGTADDNILPEGDFTERFEYDSNGRIVKQISFEGIIVTFNYDEQGRVKSKQYFENQVKYFTNSPSQTWTYEYDSQGRVTKINQNGRITETTYDSQGRTTSIKTPEGTVYYEYDKLGCQTRVSSNKGDNISYSYDIFGRLETVTNNANGDVTKYEYDLVGNLSRTTTKTSQATLVTTYEYDNMNRLIKETNFVDKNNNQKFDADEGISQFIYELDKQGRKTSAIEKFWQDINNDEIIDELFNDIRWQYDDAGRLIKEVFDHYDDNFDQTSEWIYDLVGNRLKQTVNGNETLYDYDSNDRLLNEIAGTKKTVYGYDHTQQTSKTVTENGELVSTTTFEYNLQGRMSVVTITTNNRTEITRYEYGTDGIRTSAEHEIYIDGELQSKIKTEYLNDPKSLTGYSQVLRQTEYDAEENIVKTVSYVIGHQRISQTIESNGEKVTHYFTFDGHGSTRALLDLAGAIVQLYAFDAYGNALGFNPADALTEFLYSGEQFDSKIGQQYLRQRYYDPTTGRFNRLDPFFGNQFDPQAFHKYLYTHADPVNGIDPTGEYFWQILAPILALGVHAWASIALDAFQFESNVSWIPDAGIIGITGTSPSVGRLIGNIINPLLRVLPFNQQAVALGNAVNVLANYASAEVGAELLFNIASAQLSVVLYAGLRLSSQNQVGVSCYTGVIWKLTNNSFYNGWGGFVEVGNGSLALTGFGDVSLALTGFSDLSYFGITLERSFLPSSGISVSGGGSYGRTMFTLDLPGSFYSILLASTWGVASASLFPATRNTYGISIATALASFWPYAKWSSPEALAARQSVRPNNN